MQISQNQNLIRIIGVTVFVCATWSLLAGSINLANDTSPSIVEKIINIPAAAAISLGGGIMFYYSRKTHILESILIMAFGLVLFAAEVNTQFGSYAVSDTSYKATSAAQQQENKKIALQEKELNDWDKVSINRSALIAERTTLEGELSAKKESSAINCKSSWKTCKAKNLAGSGEIEAKISAVNSQLDLAEKKDSALSSAKYTFSTVGKDDYKKQHPHFISTAELLYDTPKKAESARILLRLIQSFAVVLLSYIGLRMAYYDSPAPHNQNTNESGNGVFSGFKGIFNRKKSTLNAATTSANAPTTTASILPFRPRLNSNEPVLNESAENSKNQATRDLNAPVITHPFNSNASVLKQVKQASLGMVICEECLKEAQKKTSTQRFCSPECRMKWHNFKLSKKAIKKG